MKIPLFLLDILLEPSDVIYSPPLATFEDVLVQLFDNAIAETHTVPQLEKVTTQK